MNDASILSPFLSFSRLYWLTTWIRPIDPPLYRFLSVVWKRRKEKENERTNEVITDHLNDEQ